MKSAKIFQVVLSLVALSAMAACTSKNGSSSDGKAAAEAADVVPSLSFDRTEIMVGQKTPDVGPNAAIDGARGWVESSGPAVQAKLTLPNPGDKKKPMVLLSNAHPGASPTNQIFEASLKVDGAQKDQNLDEAVNYTSETKCVEVQTDPKKNEVCYLAVAIVTKNVFYPNQASLGTTKTDKTVYIFQRSAELDKDASIQQFNAQPLAAVKIYDGEQGEALSEMDAALAHVARLRSKGLLPSSKALLEKFLGVDTSKNFVSPTTQEESSIAATQTLPSAQTPGPDAANVESTSVGGKTLPSAPPENRTKVLKKQ